MKRELFVCTKPLQYFNIRNIVNKDSSSFKTLIIKDNFRKSKEFAIAIKEKENLWNSIIHTKTTLEYYKSIVKSKADTLYIDNDSSGFFAIYCRLLRKAVYVFEEGYGTYRRYAIKESVSKNKYLLYKLLGIRERIGNAVYLKGIYVYLPQLYQKLFPNYSKEIKSFNATFLESLKENASLFYSLSNDWGYLKDIKNKSIIIYLTSHHINNDIIEYLKRERFMYDLVYIKPHPHIKNLKDFKTIEFQIIYSNIMIELLLLLFLENNNNITVVHENSTSIIWFQNSINSINMGYKLAEYDIITSYIRDNKI